VTENPAQQPERHAREVGEHGPGFKSKIQNRQSKIMRYERILAALNGATWAMCPRKFEEIRAVVEARGQGITASAAEIQAIVAKKKKYSGINGGVYVLPLFGVISQRIGLMSEASGGTSIEAYMREFEDALADPQVGAILSDIDSPGGSVAGVQEAAARIYAARGQKPLVGIANAQAASAAFWLGTAFDEFVITPSGEAGSLGVFTAHEDYSAQNEADGRKVTYVSAGPYKTEWNPDGPLSKEAFDFEQQRINEYYEAFVDGVAKGRGVTSAQAKRNFGGGRCLSATACVEAGMADRVAPFAQVLAELNAARKPAGTRAKGAEGGGQRAEGESRTPAASKATIALLRKRLELRKQPG
jgi:capsid assembly protease